MTPVMQTVPKECLWHKQVTSAFFTLVLHQLLLAGCTPFSTLHQRFIYIHLLYPYLITSWIIFSKSLSTLALYQSTIWWFEARSCKPTSAGLPYNWFPPSLLQHAVSFIAVRCFSAHIKTGRTDSHRYRSQSVSSVIVHKYIKILLTYFLLQGLVLCR